MQSQRREQGRIALSWNDVTEILIDHFRQSGAIPPGTCDVTIDVRAIPGDSVDVDERRPDVDIEFSSVWDGKFEEASFDITKLDDVHVSVKKLLESLRGHVNVLKTHNPKNEADRRRIDDWIDVHEYLERLVLVFAGVNPDRVEG